MRQFKRNAKNEEVRELMAAQKDRDEATLEPSFEGVASDRTFSRREAVGLTGAALAGFATLAAAKADPASAEKTARVKEKVQEDNANEDKVLQLGGQVGAAGFSLTGRAYRHKFSQPVKGFVKARLYLSDVTPSSHVFVSISEGHLGDAKYLLYSVVAGWGYVDIRANIDWGSPLPLYADYLLIDP